MSKDKVQKFLQENKAEIAGGLALAAAGVIGYKIGMKVAKRQVQQAWGALLRVAPEETMAYIGAIEKHCREDK